MKKRILILISFLLAHLLAACGGGATPTAAMHSGGLPGLPPTGKLRVMGAYIDRIVDGQIVERAVILDQTSLIAQLGLLIMPGKAD